MIAAVLFFFAVDPAANKRAEVERAATAAARPALQTMCGGRCELVDVRADVTTETKVKDALPGFEQLAKEETELTVRALELTVAIDSRLGQQTRAGIKEALEAALRGTAKQLDVRLRAFEWPALREQAPIVVQMPQQQAVQRETAPAPIVVPPQASGPPAEEGDLGVRFQRRLVDTAPWLIGALLFALILRSGLRRTEPVPAAASAPVGPSPHDAKEGPRKESALGERALADRSLAAHVLARLLGRLRPEEAATLVPLVPIDALSDAVHGARATELAHVLQLARAKTTIDGAAVAAFDAHVVEAARECLHDPRLFRLHLLSAEVLAAVLLALPPADRVRAFVHSAPDVRDAAAQLMGEGERQALVSRVMTAVARGETACDDETAQRIDQVCEAKARAARLLEGVAEDAVRVGVEAPSPAWERILQAQTVSETDVAAASEDALTELVFAVLPETLVDYLHGAQPAAKDRLVKKLPAYLQRAFEQSISPPPAALDTARREVLLAFLRLRRQKDAGARRAIVALLSEADAHAPMVKVVK